MWHVYHNDALAIAWSVQPWQAVTVRIESVTHPLTAGGGSVDDKHCAVREAVFVRQGHGLRFLSVWVRGRRALHPPGLHGGPTKCSANSRSMRCRPVLVSIS